MGTNTNIIKFFRVYSKLLKMSDLGKCPRVGFLGIVRGTQGAILGKRPKANNKDRKHE